MRHPALSTVAAVLVTASLFGCASTSDVSPKPVTEAPSSQPAQAEVATPTPEAETSERTPIMVVADVLGVVDYTQSSQMAPFASQWGEGTFEGSRVQIYEFASEADYSSFLESVSSFGVTDAQLVRSGLVVVAPTDQTKTESIRALLG